MTDIEYLQKQIAILSMVVDLSLNVIAEHLPEDKKNMLYEINDMYCDKHNELVDIYNG